jgi:hypothetical protein
LLLNNNYYKTTGNYVKRPAHFDFAGRRSAARPALALLPRPSSGAASGGIVGNPESI